MNDNLPKLIYTSVEDLTAQIMNYVGFDKHKNAKEYRQYVMKCANMVNRILERDGFVKSIDER